jgi:hypothetical protein
VRRFTLPIFPIFTNNAVTAAGVLCFWHPARIPEAMQLTLLNVPHALLSVLFRPLVVLGTVRRVLPS